MFLLSERNFLANVICVVQRANLQECVNLASYSSLVRANHLINFLSVLEDSKCRHGSDTLLLSDLADLVHVDLYEGDCVLVFVLVGHLDDFRSDDFARTAPSGEIIDDDNLIGRALDHGGIEGSLTMDLVNATSGLFGCSGGRSRDRARSRW